MYNKIICYYYTFENYTIKPAGTINHIKPYINSQTVDLRCNKATCLYLFCINKWKPPSLSELALHKV